MVGRRLLPALLVHVALCALASTAAAQVPSPTGLPAPTLLTPANGASVTVPFTISWAEVRSPNGVFGYEWEISASSTFTSLLFTGPLVTDSLTTQDIISGLPNGTYFWRVHVYDGFGNAVSETRSFTVTGAGPGTPASPVLAPPLAYNTFHPCEAGYTWWSAVPEARTYWFQIAKDPAFPTNALISGWMLGASGPVVDAHVPSPPATGVGGIGHLPVIYPCTEGNYFARVFAVNADGIRSLPSNVISYSSSVTSPIGPPPRALSPLNGETLTLPITLKWEHVPNPNAYEVQISADPTFLTFDHFGSTYPELPLGPLASGVTRFWRVRANQGLSILPIPGIPGDLGVAAFTAWSATGSFTVSSAPPTIISVNGFPQGNGVFLKETFSGGAAGMTFQLSAAAPVSGLVVNCTSSNPDALPVAASGIIPPFSWQGGCGGTAGQVTTPTVVTVTATVGSSTASFDVTVLPTVPGQLMVWPDAAGHPGGTPVALEVKLRGGAPPGGAVVSLSSDSPSVIVPSTVTVPEVPWSSVTVPFTTSVVTQFTVATITATYNGVSTQTKILVTPERPPASVTLSRTSVIAGQLAPVSVGGKVTAASPSAYIHAFPITSSNPAVATVSPSLVTRRDGADFSVTVNPVSVATAVTISATGAGVTQSAELTIYPAGTAPLLDSVTVSPTRVIGGSGAVTLGGVLNGLFKSATGEVFLNARAPAGGLVVTLSSDSAAVTVPASVTVLAGDDYAVFPVTTSAVTAQTTATISATLGTTSSTMLKVLSTPVPVIGNVLVFASAWPGLVGGNSITGVVTLATCSGSSTPVGQCAYAGGAPAGGVVVQFFSDPLIPGVVGLPASVTIPEGASQAKFTVTTSPVPFPISVTIWGAIGDQAQTALGTFDWLTVAPPPDPVLTFTSLTLDPSTVVGPGPSTATVTFSMPAPAGGTSVGLYNPSSLMSPFASSTQEFIRVPAGSTSATIPVTTYPVSVSVPVMVTAGSQQAALTIESSQPTLTGLSLNPTTVIGGVGATGTVTLSSAAPAGGVIVTLANNSSSVNVPPSVTIPAGATSANFTIGTSSVSTTTAVTITASLGGSTRTAILTYNPTPPAPTAPTLLGPADQATVAQPITFTWNGAANATTYRIEIANTSTFTTTLASQTTSGSQATISGLPAQRLWWRVRGVNAAGIAGPFSASRRITAQAAPPAPPPPAAAGLSAVSVNPASVVGGNSATGTVTLTSAAPSGGLLVTLSSSNATVASLPASVTVAAGATSASFAVTTSSVASATPVTITGTQGTTTRTASLTVNAVPPPASLSAITLSPSTVTGGGPATGTVTLTSAAPSGGLVVTLSSSNATIASLSSSVTVAAGATSATFAVTTGSVTSATAITITGSGGGTIRTATLTISPPPTGAVLTLTATGRAGESVSSSPAGLIANVGTTGSSSFPTGTAVTLTVSNGRVAIWSGGCSSNGAKVKSCTFTINAATSVTANVQ